MNVVAVLMGVAAMVFIVNKVYRTPDKVVFTENDNEFTAAVNGLSADLVNSLGLTSGEQLVLQESATAGDVIVKAKGNSEIYKAIGTVSDAEFYKKVQQKRARAKIKDISGTEVIIAYSYS